MFAASRLVDRMLRAIATAAGGLFFVLTAVIVFDVVTRKFGYQVPGFGSTRLQELEGHLHAALFALWFGFAYVRNAHVRIDIALAGASPRALAWLELLGCLVFALPFSLIALWFGGHFAWVSFRQNEASVSASGLPYLFIPKAVLALGLALLALAVVSIMLRSLVFLFGPARLRAKCDFAAYHMRARE